MSGGPTITDLDILIGQNAKKIRKDRKLTLEAAADGMDISYSLLSQMERGNRSWGTDKILKAMQYYGVEIEQLVFAQNKLDKYNVLMGLMDMVEKEKRPTNS